MLPPSVAIECRSDWGGRSGEFCGRRSSERAVHAMRVVVAREFVQRNHFYLPDLEHAQVGEPAVESNIRQSEMPSMFARSTPKPIMRRVNTSMTTSTQ
jgi:hypothetical protein